MLSEDEILQKLAYQIGVLTLLRDERHISYEVEKALETIDSLIETISRVRPA